nr:hypothetical protein [uncultured Mediterranean phage uvMED]
MIKFISFLINYFLPTISISDLDFSNVGYDLTESIFKFYYESDDYVMGLLDFTTEDGLLEWDIAEEFLNEYQTNLDEYELETNDKDFTTLGIVSFVGI